MLEQYKLVVPREDYANILTEQGDFQIAIADPDIWDGMTAPFQNHSSVHAGAFLQRIFVNRRLDIVTRETSGNGIDVPLIMEMGKIQRNRYDLAKAAGNEKLVERAIGAMEALASIKRLLDKGEETTEE